MVPTLFYRPLGDWLKSRFVAIPKIKVEEYEFHESCQKCFCQYYTAEYIDVKRIDKN